MSRYTLFFAGVLVAAFALTGCSVPRPLSAPSSAPSSPTPSSRAVVTEPEPDPGPVVREDLVGLSIEELNSRLIQAAWANNVAEAEQLIIAGADVNAKDDTVQSAYLISTSEGYLDFLNLTLANGADVASLDWYNGTGLIRAAERGHAAIVGRLVRAGISLDHVNNPGWVALHEALLFAKATQVEAYQDTARVLVAAGANLEIPAVGDGETPLRMAQRRGLQVQENLMNRAITAPVNSVNAQAELMRAVEIGDPNLAALAIRAGASVTQPDAGGRTAREIAAAGAHGVTLRLIENLGG
ncbi:ankyrin repeat domain-containing protein [Lysinibacter sp. HNR]|uniref:ankyrin repeat domain-containing protein n=1 Tax=Lysinibacter sp. HNR TaxID=3031408 RepID=UPI0024359B66|nr:ankyrin repeat domain-containing protein [Lysinibacter sp. HNR]WGD36662.1 ankyrin repeat domain-containing protein [Lysinibacter sp. HNR]